MSPQNVPEAGWQIDRFGDDQSGSQPQAPRTLVKVVPRLIGSAKNYQSMIFDLDNMAYTTGNVPEDEETLILFQRGDAKEDWDGNIEDDVNLVDALYIAQYLAKLRTLDTMNAVNAASVAHDGANGDKITIVDALFIAQYKAMLRDEYFELPPGPGGPSAPESPESDAMVEVGYAFVPPSGTAQIPITVRDIVDADGLGAYDFQVTFDPAIIRVDSVQPGQAPFDGVTSSIDNTNGVVFLNYFHTNMPGPIADTVVAYLNVTAIGNPWDVTDLDLTITTLSDTEGAGMPAWDYDGFVCITG